jgi:hypothetical protein
MQKRKNKKKLSLIPHSAPVATSYKAPLSVVIEKEYKALIATISQVPEALHTTKLVEGTGGQVSVKDIVAYQIGWGQFLIDWYTTGLTGQIPQMPGGGFTAWDYTGLAHHFYAAYGQHTLAEQLTMFHAIVQKILAIVEREYEQDNLHKLDVWAWCTLTSGKQWPLSKWITINTSAPYKRATGLVKKILKTV